MNETAAISELILQLARHFEARANTSGMKPAQWNALRYLATVGPEARTSTDFARYHQTTTGPAALTMNVLVDKGYVRKIPDEQDGRRLRLDLTAKGIEKLKDDPLNELAQRVGKLSESQVSALTSALTRMLIESPAMADD